MEERTGLGLLAPCVLAGASPPAPHISRTLLSPQEGSESPQERPSTKIPPTSGFSCFPQDLQYCFVSARVPPHPARRHPGVLPGLGDPQHLLLPGHPDPDGTHGYGNSLGAETSLHSQAGDPVQPQGGDVGAQPPRAPCVTGQGTRRGPGLTCACGSCGSEREEDTRHQTPTCKGSRGLANTQRITQHPARAPAEAGGCHGDCDTLQGIGQHPGRALP